MKSVTFIKLNSLILENIEESQNVTDLEFRLDLIKRTIQSMKQPKRKIYEVPALYKKDKLY